MIDKSQYSRKATRDVRGAMALGLARHLEDLTFLNVTNGTFRFARVFDTWPSYTARYVPPSAVVLPASWTYADWAMTPHLLEDTWEPKGESGFGLYKLSEAEVNFEVSIRTDNVAERDAIILGVEESFRAPNLLMDEAKGARYGVIVELPEYYGMCARFALQGARVIDDEERAMREQRDAIFTISGQAPQVTVGPVFPLGLTVRLTTC